MTSEQVARVAVKGLFRGKAEIVPGFVNKLNAWLPKFISKTFAEKIAGSIYEPRKEDAYSVSTSFNTSASVSHKTVLYRYDA